MRPIYITGHKNPDTDSIISSIAYARYKKEKGIEAIASRIGPVSSDTEFLLNRFGFEDPLHIYTAKSTVREINFDKAVLIKSSTTIKEALDKLKNKDSRILYVSDKDRDLLGIVTISSITNIWIAEQKSLSKMMRKASLKNIAKVLKAKILVEPKEFVISGDVEVSPSSVENIKQGTIVVTSNINKIEKAISNKAGLIVVLNKTNINSNLINKAKNNGVAIMSSSLSALEVSKNIYNAPTVETIMEKADKVIKIKDSLTIDEATSIIASHRYRAYPIMDVHNKLIGSISRYHLLNYEKKKLILVDHNEKKQSIDDIDFGEVIEIVDHHRFGGFESDNPISITTQIVGATCTIIANKFFSEKIKLDKKLAGLLLGGIVADTMNFKSPTTTSLDIATAKKLESISGENCDELQEGLIKASVSLINKRAKDIVYDDFKEFNLSGNKVGLSQAICKSFDELKAIRSPLSSYVEEMIQTNNYDLFVIMFTDPNGSGSYVLYFGRKSSIVEKALPTMDKITHFVNHLVSRKKQLLPAIAEELGK